MYKDSRQWQLNLHYRALTHPSRLDRLSRLWPAHGHTSTCHNHDICWMVLCCSRGVLLISFRFDLFYFTSLSQLRPNYKLGTLFWDEPSSQSVVQRSEVMVCSGVNNCCEITNFVPMIIMIWDNEGHLETRVQKSKSQLCPSSGRWLGKLLCLTNSWKIKIISKTLSTLMLFLE